MGLSTEIDNGVPPVISVTRFLIAINDIIHEMQKKKQ